MSQPTDIRIVPALDQLRVGPPTLDVGTASAVLGISRAHGYAQAARGQFPCRVIKVGGRYRVVTASLVRLLEGDQPLGAA